MQDRALAIMGKKLSAAKVLEGKFTSEGLAALAGEDGEAQLALARSLANGIDEGGADHCWEKVAAAPPPIISITTARMDHLKARFAAIKARLHLA